MTLAKYIAPKYMPPLDGLRGIACLLVVLAHMSEIAHIGSVDHVKIGALGVGLFFTLSGFLMGALYLVVEPFTPATATKYAAARISRIAPAYLIAVTFYIMLTLTMPGYDPIGIVQAVRLFLFSGSASVFWSIPPEVQFYGFFFVLWFGIASLRGKKPALGIKVLLAGLLAITLAGIALRSQWPGILLLSKLHLFLLGVLGAVVISRPSFTKHLGSIPVQILTVCATAAYFLLVLKSDQMYQDLTFATLLALMITSLSQSTLATNWLSTPTFRFLGAASFSIYLFHGSVIRLTDLLVTPLSQTHPVLLLLVALVAIIIPSIFHVLVEKRLNRAAKAYLTKKLKHTVSTACTVMNKIFVR